MCVYPQHTDMSEEMRVETMELCVTACEKFATNNEVRPHCVFTYLLCLEFGQFIPWHTAMELSVFSPAVRHAAVFSCLPRAQQR